jgi:Icc-related predicted phosphoesterase
MDKIVLLDTAVGSTNKGDEIIMRCAREELEDIITKYFVMTIPTHLSAFSALECFGPLPDSASEVEASKYKFICGTNLLSGNMLHRTNQWDINIFNVKPILGSILVGVGGAATANRYTRYLYNKVLSHNYIHSVRDKAAYELITGLGLKCEYTGCLTMWKLTPDFCEQIPRRKKDGVIFTLTDYNQDEESDRKIIEILKKNYSKRYFWVQGAHDYDYLNSIADTNGIEIIGPNIDEYSSILECGGVDYVGTRLHACVFAMRHKVRSLIIRVDNRMDAMSMCIPNNTISRTKLDLLDERINQDMQTICDIDWDAVNRWKGQFK